MISARTRNLVLAAIGGLGWALVPFMDDTWSGYWTLVPAVPPLLGFGLLELRRRYRKLWGRYGRIGGWLLAAGLAFLLVAAVLRATLAGLVAVFVIAPFAVAGFVALGVGSIFLALTLRRLGVLSTPAAAAFALAALASPVVNAILTALIGFGVGVYGLAWIGLVSHLSRVEELAVVRTHQSPAPTARRPQRAVAGFVGVVMLVLGASGFLPLGPISGTPFAGQSTVLDAFHLVVGLMGVGVVFSSEHVARAYNAVAGVVYAIVSVIPFVAIFDIAVLPDVAPFMLNLTDMVVHLPATLISLGVAAADLLDMEGGIDEQEE